jgi:hypothetical protein
VLNEIDVMRKVLVDAHARRAPQRR